MSKEKKMLKSTFTEIIKDILDHFDEYTPVEQQAIKNQLTELYVLNTTLDKYDKNDKSMKAKILKTIDKLTGIEE